MFRTASAFIVAGSVGWKEEDWELSHHLGKDARQMHLFVVLLLSEYFSEFFCKTVGNIFSPETEIF